LRITACYRDDCIGIAANGAPNDLPAFFVTRIRNRAGVNQINISRLLEIDLLVAIVLE
jgi:hypothetical protein